MHYIHESETDILTAEDLINSQDIEDNENDHP